MPTETGDGCTEWSRYYHDHELHGLDVLHARFIEHRYARHAHNYFVVALVETGAASYWYRGAQRAASAGQVFVINPDEPHTGDPATPSGYVYRVLYPRAEHVATVAADIGTTKNAIFFKESVLHDPRLAILLTDFHKHFALRASAAECESLLLAALERLIICHSDPRIMPRPVGRERPPVRTACEYIQAHFADDVSLSKLAALVSLSPYYFARAFERETGLPPHAYLETVRIRKAREFLDRGHTVVSAALSVGYADQSHLTHRFKRFLGITPGQYVRESKFQQDENERRR
ncbi:MAG: AraC family ligand binding domain-containing protein [Candidatus Sulfotelmatobacter sp.]|jgi:AraC-like DNA-binding protein